MRPRKGCSRHDAADLTNPPLTVRMRVEGGLVGNLRRRRMETPDSSVGLGGFFCVATNLRPALGGLTEVVPMNIPGFLAA